MQIPKDKELYERVKKIVNEQYKKPSAYRSGAYVRLYKQMGGEYETPKNKKTNANDFPLKRWYSENWEDVNPNKTKNSYPVYRPTRRVTNKTPKTVDEIPEKRLKEQAKLKQKIKGIKNLPKF